MSRRTGLSRRDALRAAAAAAATAGCTKGGGDSGNAGDSGVVAGGIDTIIFVMMENRSYDHFLGARSLLEGLEGDGLTDDIALPGADGSTVVPARATELCVDDPGHSHSNSLEQYNDGANDGFCTNYGNRYGGSGAGAAAYLTREELPITWALADAFTECDRYFCSMLGPTWPNRLYGHLGSSQGQSGNDFPDGSAGFTDQSVWETLNDAGVDWAYYYTDGPFLGLIQGVWDDDKVGMLEEFFEAAAEGSLPPVVWVDPGFVYNDNHPPHHPGLGELFIGSIYEAMATSPQWDRCLIVITYDEHGGFYDHVPPPECDDDRDETAFRRLGFRVPTLLLGPWVKPGVNSTVFDHTSWLKFVCEQHGLEPWTARIAAANSLAEALDADAMEAGTPLPAVELPAFDFDPETVGDECFYNLDTMPEHLRALREHCEKVGVPHRLDDRQRVERIMPMLRFTRARGLVG